MNIRTCNWFRLRSSFTIYTKIYRKKCCGSCSRRLGPLLKSPSYAIQPRTGWETTASSRCPITEKRVKRLGLSTDTSFKIVRCRLISRKKNSRETFKYFFCLILFLKPTLLLHSVIDLFTGCFFLLLTFENPYLFRYVLFL